MCLRGSMVPCPFAIICSHPLRRQWHKVPCHSWQRPVDGMQKNCCITCASCLCLQVRGDKRWVVGTRWTWEEIFKRIDGWMNPCIITLNVSIELHCRDILDVRTAWRTRTHCFYSSHLQSICVTSNVYLYCIYFHWGIRALRNHPSDRSSLAGWMYD